MTEHCKVCGSWPAFVSIFYCGELVCERCWEWAAAILEKKP